MVLQSPVRNSQVKVEGPLKINHLHRVCNVSGWALNRNVDINISPGLPACVFFKLMLALSFESLQGCRIFPNSDKYESGHVNIAGSSNFKTYMEKIIDLLQRC